MLRIIVKILGIYLSSKYLLADNWEKIIWVIIFVSEGTRILRKGTGIFEKSTGKKRKSTGKKRKSTGKKRKSTGKLGKSNGKLGKSNGKLRRSNGRILNILILKWKILIIIETNGVFLC